jgi:hypothetical protein
MCLVVHVLNDIGFVSCLFGFTVHQHNPGHSVPKQERRFFIILGVTNLKQHQGSIPPHLLELKDA